jgi:hypothetical protein
MHVELLFWDGCPSHPTALVDLRKQMAALGLNPGDVELREVTSAEQAEQERFVGSPTIRVDGADVVDVRDEPPALNCRVYRSRDGRILARPDPADVRDALEAALARTPSRSACQDADESASQDADTGASQDDWPERSSTRPQRR